MECAAFFDLDNTIVKGNCGLRCLVRYFFRGDISMLEASRIMKGYLGYVLGSSDPVQFFSTAFRFLKGKDAKQEEAWCAEYFDRKLSRRLFRQALKLVEWHRKQGHRIVIATNSLSFKIKRVSDIVRPDFMIPSRMEVVEGRFTGRTEQVAFGKNKAKLVEEYARKQGIDLKKSYAYSDNSSDIPLLGLVGNPVAVNPQMGMRRHARRNGWKVLRFSEVVR